MVRERGEKVFCICLVIIFDAEIINTEAEVYRPCFVFPEAYSMGYWFISMAAEVRYQVVIGKYCCLF